MPWPLSSWPPPYSLSLPASRCYNYAIDIGTINNNPSITSILRLPFSSQHLPSFPSTLQYPSSGNPLRPKAHWPHHTYKVSQPPHGLTFLLTRFRLSSPSLPSLFAYIPYPPIPLPRPLPLPGNCPDWVVSRSPLVTHKFLKGWILHSYYILDFFCPLYIQNILAHLWPQIPLFYAMQASTPISTGAVLAEVILMET